MIKSKQSHYSPEIRNENDIGQFIDQSEEVCLCRAATIFGISKLEARKQVQQLVLVMLPGENAERQGL